VKALRHGAIPFRHLGDLCEHVAFTVRLAPARTLQLSAALLHRGSFLGSKSRGRGGVLADFGAPFVADLLSAIAKLLSVLKQPKDIAIGVRDGGHQAAATDVTVSGGKIVEIDILADPERLARPELTAPEG
jgi:hypothetical protein